MKISYNWLREYVDIDLSPEELADRLTMLGLEVDDLERQDLQLEGLVVAHVKAVRPHPNADRLVLCDVDSGNGEVVQVVCGAPNVKADQKVALAPPGTELHLPDRDDPTRRKPITLRKAKIRGQVSNGMICAEDEIGLSEDHSGIMVLEPDAEPGTPLEDYLSEHGLYQPDAILDIELTPNRPDATSHIGVAREISADTGGPLRMPEPDPDEHAEPSDPRVSIRIDAPEACGRYVGILVEGVTMGPSPDRMQTRLSAVGLRPLNNIVDITNYVMYELGQPLHAFDYELLNGGGIVVRFADEGERFVTLDDQERKLDAQMLMICDLERTVAIGGVMGGENSEVSDTTTNVLIESAWFEPSGIRRTSRKLGLQTDASYRFERGVDPNGSLRAALRAAEMIADIAGGKIVEIHDEHPAPHEPVEINLRASRVEKILGVNISPNQIATDLRGLGFEVEETEDQKLHCVVPSFRPDVTREIDLIEEVGRRFGFDRIPSPDRTAIPYTAQALEPVKRLRRESLTYLAGLGFREVYNNSLISPATAEQFAALHDGPPVTTYNALSADMSALRSSLVPELLKTLAYNWNRGQRRVRLAEFGHVFHRTDQKQDVVVDGYLEREVLALLLAGAAGDQSWDRDPRPADIYDLKGVVAAIARFLNVRDLDFESSDETNQLLDLRLDLMHGTDNFGLVGRVAAPVAEQFDLEMPVFVAELFWSQLARAGHRTDAIAYRPFSRFPSVERDLALLVRKTLPVGDLLDTVKETGRPLLESVDVFDVYEGSELAEEQRSVALSLKFTADRNLTDREVEEQLEKILQTVSREHDAELRS